MRNVVGEGGDALHAIVGTILIDLRGRDHLDPDRPVHRDLSGAVRPDRQLARGITFLVTS